MRAPQPGEFEMYDHETVTVGAGPVGLTAAKASASFMARLDVEGAELRYWTDGSAAPTATQGILAGPGAIIYVYATDIQRFRAIRTAASNAVIQVSYGRWPRGKRGSFNDVS
jgi:hypothetical protein